MRASRVPHSVLGPLSGEREGDPRGTIHANILGRGGAAVVDSVFLAPKTNCETTSCSAVDPNGQQEAARQQSPPLYLPRLRVQDTPARFVHPGATRSYLFAD